VPLSVKSYSWEVSNNCFNDKHDEILTVDVWSLVEQVKSDSWKPASSRDGRRIVLCHSWVDVTLILIHNNFPVII
jgi:uncharacterized protein YdeI (YjbR/CyaY-like superfamily)